MPFDARSAKLLQPGEHIILQEHPGLRLEVSTSRRTWIYRYKSPVDDRMRQIKLGEWPGMAYGEAVMVWAVRNGERAAGKDPALERKQERRKREAAATRKRAGGAYLVQHLVQDYLADHVDTHRKEKGRKEVRRVLESHTKPIEMLEAASLLRRHAYDLIKGLDDRPVIAAQVRQEMGAAWDYGLDSGKLPENTPNWWRQVLRGKLRSKGKKLAGEHVGTTKRVLSEQELGDLINWLPNFSRTVRDALTMYLWTGTRGAEIMAAEKDEIRQEPTGWWWTIPKHKTKNLKREHATDLRVPLIGRAQEIALRRAAATDRFLFAAPTNKCGYTEQKAVQSAVWSHMPYATRRPDNGTPLLPVTRWSPHDLRRSVRTLLAKLGCPNDVAESVLGHMLQGVVGVYNLHTYDAERVEWLTRLDARLEELARMRRDAGGVVAQA